MFGLIFAVEDCHRVKSLFVDPFLYRFFFNGRFNFIDSCWSRSTVTEFHLAFSSSHSSIQILQNNNKIFLTRIYWLWSWWLHFAGLLLSISSPHKLPYQKAISFFVQMKEHKKKSVRQILNIGNKTIYIVNMYVVYTFRLLKLMICLILSLPFKKHIL